MQHWCHVVVAASSAVIGSSVIAAAVVVIQVNAVVNYLCFGMVWDILLWIINTY